MEGPASDVPASIPPLDDAPPSAVMIPPSPPDEAPLDEDTPDEEAPEEPLAPEEDEDAVLLAPPDELLPPSEWTFPPASPPEPLGLLLPSSVPGVPGMQPPHPPPNPAPTSTTIPNTGRIFMATSRLCLSVHAPEDADDCS